MGFSVGVVEAYRLGKYDNYTILVRGKWQILVVEAYRLGKYDNSRSTPNYLVKLVVEAYRLGKYDNFIGDFELNQEIRL